MRRRADGKWCAVDRAPAAPARGPGRLARGAVVVRALVRPSAQVARAVVRRSLEVARAAFGPRVALTRSLAQRCLRVVRQVVGAPDYQRYLEHQARCHPGGTPLDRRGYYMEFVTRRFGPGPTRCC